MGEELKGQLVHDIKAIQAPVNIYHCDVFTHNTTLVQFLSKINIAWMTAWPAKETFPRKMVAVGVR